LWGGNDITILNVILNAVLVISFIAIIINILIIASKKTGQKTKLVNKFCLGILLMLVSLLGGFSIGAYIIFFAIVVWADILIKNYNNKKIKFAAYILLAVTLVETWLLKPG